MLFFVPSKSLIEKKLTDLNSKNKPTELISFSREALTRFNEVYWTCIEFINFNDKTIKLIDIKKYEEHEIHVSLLHLYTNVALFKYLSSINLNKESIFNALKLLKENFKGHTINDIETMKFFFNKNYLLDLQKSGFNLPLTYHIKSKTTLLDIQNLIGDGNFIIKPISGELSLNVEMLFNIDDTWLKDRELKVDSWIIQEFSKNVWDGEFQLVFFGDQFSHGLHKKYKQSNGIPLQEERSFDEYKPTSEEVDFALKVKEHVENKMGKKIYYFRLDFFKTASGPTLLEFEAVNPGFFFTYLPENVILNVAKEFIDYIFNITEEKVTYGHTENQTGEGV